MRNIQSVKPKGAIVVRTQMIRTVESKSIFTQLYYRCNKNVKSVNLKFLLHVRCTTLCVFYQ